MLPLPKSMVVLSLAVPEKHTRQNFFLYINSSVSQMPRAAAFWAHNYPATGILPPHRGAEMDGMGRRGRTNAVPPVPARSPLTNALALPVCGSSIAARLQPVPISTERGKVGGGGVALEDRCWVWVYCGELRCRIASLQRERAQLLKVIKRDSRRLGAQPYLSSTLAAFF